jgi:hypothetical protein
MSFLLLLISTLQQIGENGRTGEREGARESGKK